MNYWQTIRSRGATSVERQRFVHEAFPKAARIVVALTILVGAGVLACLPVVFGVRYVAAAILAVPLALTLPGRVLAPALRQILLLHGRGHFATLALAAGAASSALL